LNKYHTFLSYLKTWNPGTIQNYGGEIEKPYE